MFGLLGILITWTFVLQVDDGATYLFDFVCLQFHNLQSTECWYSRPPLCLSYPHCNSVNHCL